MPAYTERGHVAAARTPQLFRVLAQDGTPLKWMTPADAGELLRRGHARTYGTRRRTLGIVLTVSTDQAFGDKPGKCSSTAAAAGLHTIHREHVGGRFYVWQHNHLQKSQSPARALARMMRGPDRTKYPALSAAAVA